MKLVKNVVKTDVDWLHKISEPVDLSSNETVRHLTDILLLAYKQLDGKCQGISAIQVGSPAQAILLRYVKGGEPIVIFNPKVNIKLGSKKSNEGCLSEGNTRYIVKRPLLIKVEYYLADGRHIVEWLPFKKARIFMHEYDHLFGVLLQDKGKKVEVVNK